MQTITLDGKKWIVNLDWEIIPVDDSDDKSRREHIKSISNKVGLNYGVFVEYEDQEVIGLVQKPTKIPSASYYLSLANQEANMSGGFGETADWVVIEDVGDDRYWIGVVNKGVPSPQFDKLLDLTSVKDQVVELITYSDSTNYKIFSKSDYIIKIFEDVAYVENRGLNELTESVIGEKVKFEKLRGIPNSVIYAGAGIAVLCIGAIAANSIYESNAMQKRIEERNRQIMLDEQRAQADYQVKLKEYENELKEKKEAARNEIVMGLSGNPSNILNSWYEAVGSIGAGVSGWEPKLISCSFNKYSDNNLSKSECSIFLSRTGLATNRMLLQEFPDAIISGNNAEVRRNVLADSAIYVKPNKDILDTLPSINNWGFDMLSQLQLMKIVDIDYEIESSEDIMITPPLKPLSPAEINQNIKQEPAIPTSIGFAKGEIKISGKSFDLLREVADNIDFSFVGVKSVNFNMGKLGEIPWEVVMDYYLNTSSGGMVGSGSGELSNVSVESSEDEDN